MVETVILCFVLASGSLENLYEHHMCMSSAVILVSMPTWMVGVSGTRVLGNRGSFSAWLFGCLVDVVKNVGGEYDPQTFTSEGRDGKSERILGTH